MGVGDARSPTMQSHMYLKIELRERLRAFVLMVLMEPADQWFDLAQESQMCCWSIR
jgi:predicted NodU family carbamoyl transferase